MLRAERRSPFAACQREVAAVHEGGTNYQRLHLTSCLCRETEGKPGPRIVVGSTMESKTRLPLPFSSASRSFLTEISSHQHDGAQATRARTRASGRSNCSTGTNFQARPREAMWQRPPQGASTETGSATTVRCPAGPDSGGQKTREEEQSCQAETVSKTKEAARPKKAGQ